MANGSAQTNSIAEGSGQASSSISREIVGIYADYFGRGPTKSRTFWHDDLVVVVLRDVFSRAEQLMIDGGRFIQVRQHRQAFQEEVEPLFRDVIERCTDRKVEAFLPQVSESGVAVEVFTLEPAAPTS